MFAKKLKFSSAQSSASRVQTSKTIPPSLQIFGYAPDIKGVLLIFPSFRILQWKVIELAK